MNGVRRAYAPDPSVVGQYDLERKDADGKPICKELIRIASSQGIGWCDFKFLNPKSGRIEPKSVYLERVGDLILGCGIYQSDRSSRSAAPLPKAVAAG
jgi:signal transduction histidine kinase